VNLARELARLEAPDELGSEARAWEVVRCTQRELPRPRRRWGLAVAPALAAVVAALALTPAGATVGRLISHALGVPHPARALFSLPARGRLLVSGRDGTWIVAADGSRRRLGPWEQASWSPHGRYVAVVGADELTVVNPLGVIQWALARPAVADPRWYPPTGFRLAYRSGGELRVVAGDGSGDRLLASGVAPVAPAWRPAHPYQLTYVQRRSLVLRDAASGRVIWTRPAAAVRELGWSADGRRLLVLSRGSVRVLTPEGDTVATIPASRGEATTDASLSPGGHALAVVRSGVGAGVLIAQLGSPRTTLRMVLPGIGVRTVEWSPNGAWLLASWPAANQWVFVAVGGRPQIAAVARIAQQFAEARANRGFPQVAGWCCTAGLSWR
jgi:hypothetical protein